MRVLPGARRRTAVLVLLAAMLVVWLPVTPVQAVEVAPETREAQLEVTADAAAPEDEGHSSEDETTAAGELDPGAMPVVSDVLESPFAFSMVGFRGRGEPDVRFRFREGDGGWSPWQLVEPLDELDGPDDGSREDRDADRAASDVDWVGEPHWVSEATAVQFAVDGGAIADVDVHVIDSMGLSENLLQRTSRWLQGLTTAPPAEAFRAQDIVTRAQWGADETIRRNNPSYATPRFSVLHHTAGSNTYTRAQAPGVVRGIYSWHVNGNGWSDIGYNFLVDRYGTVYEGRFGGMDRGVVGAHARNYNSGSFGVAIMGNFEVGTPPQIAVDAASQVIAWKYAVHNIDPNPSATTVHNGNVISRLVGHRDVGQTACPGRELYQRMPAMRTSIQSIVASYAAGWIPVTGDWSGSGQSSVGWYKDGIWRLFDRPDPLSRVQEFTFGKPGDLPVTGDWNGDGRTTVGVVSSEGQWQLRNSNSPGPVEITFRYGRGGIDYPMAGDWNGDGRYGPAVVRDGEWHLRNSLSGGNGQIVFTYGRVLLGDVPLVGDWNGDGRYTPAILRDREWHLRNSHSGGPGEVVFIFGRLTQGDIPITGNWNGDVTTGIAVTRTGQWHLRNTLSGGAAEISFFGL